jgi:pyrrolidone-carboxylate peptidase
MAHMSVDGIRRALVQARQDGKVDTGEVDRIMLAARDAGGLDAAERTELLSAADGFDDATRQRVLTHLAAMGQKNAWVNVEVQGQLANVRGRYADLSVGVPGLSARVGLFDNCLGLKGRAKADGVMKLNVEGATVQVTVQRGETAAQILSRVREQLPSQVAGVLLRGEVGPYDPASFNGAAARSRDTSAHLMLYKPEALGLKPGEKPLRVVVTGYGAFMGITDNPSANMAQKLAELGVRGAIVEYRRLDVTTQAVDAFVAEMRKSPPDVILSMGVTGGQAQVEERPENYIGAAPDGNNQPITARTIRPGGPDELPTDLPVETIDWALSGFGGDRRVHTSRSDAAYQPDRSAYLCNYLGYHLASEFGQRDATTAGFMHINRETPVDQMHAVLEAITARQLEWRRQPRPPVG